MEKINLMDFQKRKFKKFYIVIYVITKEIRIRTDSCITNKDLYILCGIDIMGNREMLGVYFNNEYDNKYWLEKFEDIKARGVEKILFFVTPKNRNIERCIKILYNDVIIENSPDRIYTKISKYFAIKKCRKMQINLKDLFLKENIEQYKISLKLFKEMYADNKIIRKMLENNEEEIENFYKYNYSIRKLLYPYYLIREMQKNLNKINTREKLCTNLNEVIEAFMPYIHTFENGRSYSKIEWLELISNIYDEYKNILEEYINE